MGGLTLPVFQHPVATKTEVQTRMARSLIDHRYNQEEKMNKKGSRFKQNKEYNIAAKNANQKDISKET